MFPRKEAFRKSELWPVRRGPCLKHQQRPDFVIQGGISLKILIPGARNPIRPQDPLPADERGVQQVLGPVAQCARQPGMLRNGKAHFGSLDQFFRDVAVENLPQ